MHVEDDDFRFFSYKKKKLSLQKPQFSMWPVEDRLFFIFIAAFSREVVAREALVAQGMNVVKREREVYLNCILSSRGDLAYQEELTGTQQERNQECLGRFCNVQIADYFRFPQIDKKADKPIIGMLEHICDAYGDETNRELIDCLFEDVCLSADVRAELKRLKLKSLTEVFKHVITVSDSSFSLY